MVTAFVGDSLTQGIPGVSYWRYLKNKRKLLNQGVGGDTLLGTSDRVRKMLVNKKYNDVDRYIIEIGTNDVLLPTLTRHSCYWKLLVKIKGNMLGCIPCKDIEMFKEKYEELLLMLIEHNKEIAIIGLPLIENSILRINDDMQKYNSVIIELAEKYAIQFLDLSFLEKEVKGHNEGSYFFGKTNLGISIDTIFTSFLPLSNIISRIRGLSVTIDSVHLNRNMAKELAFEIEQRLL